MSETRRLHIGLRFFMSDIVQCPAFISGPDIVGFLG